MAKKGSVVRPGRVRGGRGKPTQRSMDVLGRKFEGIMRADVKGAFSTWAKRADYDRVADAVYSGDWRKVFASMPLDDMAPIFEEGMQGAGKAVATASEIEGDAMASMDLPGGGRAQPDQLVVGLQNPKVQEYIATRTGELIQNVTDDLQANVRTSVAIGLANQYSPRQVAGLIRDNLPLNVRQQSALARYKQNLASTTMSPKRQAELGERMRNALVDTRATTIARTESQYAINHGQALVWQKAVADGLIGSDATRIWVCEAEPCKKICAPMDGQVRALNEPFTGGDGASYDLPPAHVNCRCGMRVGHMGSL